MNPAVGQSAGAERVWRAYEVEETAARSPPPPPHTCRWHGGMAAAARGPHFPRDFYPPSDVKWGFSSLKDDILLIGGTAGRHLPLSCGSAPWRRWGREGRREGKVMCRLNELRNKRGKVRRWFERVTRDERGEWERGLDVEGQVAGWTHRSFQAHDPNLSLSRIKRCCNAQ